MGTLANMEFTSQRQQTAALQGCIANQWKMNDQDRDDLCADGLRNASIGSICFLIE